MPKSHYLNPKYPAIWHGGDYNPEQWPASVWPEDIRLMKAARFSVATLGVFSWAELEPEEGRFEFEWLDTVIAGLTEADRWFVLATPSAAPPAWLSRKYPETLRTGADRVRRLHGNRVNYSAGSSIYREKTREVARRLAARYGQHPRLLAWHVSNEYGGADYGVESAEQFRAWLKRKFNDDLDALNDAYWTRFWGHAYQGWEQIEPPGGPYGETSIQGLTVDWRRFVTDQTIELMLNEAAPLREASPEVPITTNLMGAYPEFNYRQLARHVDFIAWDSYPGFPDRPTDVETWVRTAFSHDLMRSLKPDRPWALMEFTPSSSNWYPSMSLKKPGAHRFEGLQAVAHGADAVEYFQWRQSRGCQEQHHGAVVSHAGAETTRVFNEVRELGIELESLAHVTGSVVEAEVAIIYDWEVAWALEASCGPVQRDKGYLQTCIAHYRPLWASGVAADILGMDDPLDKYKLVIAPMAYSLRPGFADRVNEFVHRGGTFVTTYLSGWVDENSLVFEGGFPGPLKDVLGIWSEEIDVLHPGHTNHVEIAADGVLGLAGRYEATEFCELIHLAGAEALGTYIDDFYAGRPALTVNRYGLGRAYYVSSRNEAAFSDTFLRALIRECGVRTAVDSDLPEGVTGRLRAGSDHEFVFLMNANSTPTSVQTREWGEVRIAARDLAIFTRDTAATSRGT